MAAYILVDILVRDAERYEEYKKLAAPSVAKYGGRYLVRGGRAERLEGEREPHRVVVLEFEDFARARAWWESAEYAPAKEIRQGIATSEMILADGA